MTENAIAKQPEASAKSPVEVLFRYNRRTSSSIEPVRFSYGGSACGKNQTQSSENTPSKKTVASHVLLPRLFQTEPSTPRRCG